MEAAAVMSSNKPIQALFNAVSTSKLRLVRLLIEGGVPVDTRNDNGQTPLLITCSSLNNVCHIRGETRESVVKYLISAGAEVNAYDATGRTALIYVVITRARASAIFDLVEAGADLWWEDNDRKCAFDYALQQQDTNLVQLLVDSYKRRNMAGLTSSSIQQAPENSLADKRQRKKKSNLKNKNNKHESDKKMKMNSGNRRRLPKSVSSSGVRSFGHRKNSGNVPFKKTESHDTLSNPIGDGKKKIRLTENIPKRTPITIQSFQQHSEEFTSSLSNISAQSTDLQQIHRNIQLCELCKSIFTGNHANIKQILKPTTSSSTSSTDNVSMEERFRRRSTGGLLGSMKMHYQSICGQPEQRSSEDEICSSTEMNEPGKHASSGKNPLIDTSFNVLSVPDSDYVRSRSISIPPLRDITHRLEKEMSMFCLRALTRSSSTQLGSEYDSDEVLSSNKSITSSADDENWSQRDVTPPHKKSPSNIGKEHSLSEACGSLIPTIVLTDYVNLPKKKSQECKPTRK